MSFSLFPYIDLSFGLFLLFERAWVLDSATPSYNQERVFGNENAKIVFCPFPNLINASSPPIGHCLKNKARAIGSIAMSCISHLGLIKNAAHCFEVCK